MTSTSPTDSTPSQNDDPPVGAPNAFSPARPRDFADLARRISSRTTDLLAVALVAVLLLSVGIQATRWWRAAPPTVADSQSVAAPLAIWDTPSDLSLEFSTTDGSLRRHSVTGDQQAATIAALEQVRHVLKSTSPDHLPTIDKSEQHWLDRLKDWPQHEQTDHGHIYVLGGPWPWVVATIATAPDEQRIAAWAFALPRANDRWMLYIADRSGNQNNLSDPGAAVPLPATATRVFGIHSATGGFITFHSTSHRLQCQSDWDRQLTAAGWTRAGDWITDAQRSVATFVREQTGRLQVSLNDADDQGTTGAADWSTSPEPPEAP